MRLTYLKNNTKILPIYFYVYYAKCSNKIGTLGSYNYQISDNQHSVTNYFLTLKKKNKWQHLIACKRPIKNIPHIFLQNSPLRRTTTKSAAFLYVVGATTHKNILKLWKLYCWGHTRSHSVVYVTKFCLYVLSLPKSDLLLLELPYRGKPVGMERNNLKRIDKYSNKNRKIDKKFSWTSYEN